MNRDTRKAKAYHDDTGRDLLETVAALMAQNLTVTAIGRRVGLSEWRVRRVAERQARVLAFIRDYTAHHVYPPTVREIVKGCELSSTSVALYNLVCLGQKGYLTRIRDVARGIALTEQGRCWSQVPPETPA